MEEPLSSIPRVKNSVMTLGDQCIKVFQRRVFLALLIRSNISDADMDAIVNYVRSRIPPSIRSIFNSEFNRYYDTFAQGLQKPIENKKECFAIIAHRNKMKALKGTCHMMHNAVRLATQLAETSLTITMDYSNWKTFEETIDLKLLRELNMRVFTDANRLTFPCTRIVRMNIDTELQNSICNHLCTMRNIVKLTLECKYDEILECISKSCPALEELSVMKKKCNSAEVVAFCGFKPQVVNSFEDVRGILHKSKRRCTKLRKLFLIFESRDPYILAIILSVFPCLEEMNFIDVQCNALDALRCIYGFNEDRYQHITTTYNLKYAYMQQGFESYVSDSSFWLVARVCPLLQKLAIILPSSNRFAKNLLGEVLSLKHIKSLQLQYVSWDPFVWFLKQVGKQLEFISVVGIIGNSLISRAHLSEISKFCPNLIGFELCILDSFHDGDIEADNFSRYSLEFPKLKYFKLVVRGISLTSLKSMLLYKHLNIIEIETFSLDYLQNTTISSKEYDDLIESPFFATAETFMLAGLDMDTIMIKKLLDASPKLRFLGLDNRTLNVPNITEQYNAISKHEYISYKEELLAPWLGFGVCKKYCEDTLPINLLG